jgi:hypothetical protein
LTEQQIEGRRCAFYDLAIGYPALPLPSELHELISTWTRRSLCGGGDVIDSQWDNPDIEILLKEAVGSILSIDPRVLEMIRTTFSGSVAVDRVFAAVRLLAANSSRRGLTAIIAEPSIDVFRLLLLDRPDVRVVSVPSPACFAVGGGWHVESLIEALHEQSERFPERQVFIVLDSPVNPSGAVAGAEQLTRLAEECGRARALLVVDHCFLIAGVHNPERLATVFDVPEDACDWIGIWDTGKTMDLNGDKLGFIMPGNARVARAVDEALSVIQSGPGRRSLMVF